MNPAYLDNLSFALGQESRLLAQTANAGKLVTGQDALADAGFVKHHVCASDQSAYDLAFAAVSQIKNTIAPVGAIVYATCIPENGNIALRERYLATGDVKHLMDFPASHLQAEFGLDEAYVVGVNQQACTGMLGSIRLAHMMLNGEPELNPVLCVTADRFPEGALYEQSYNLISDGAAAATVSSAKGGFRIVACHGITNGAMPMASDDESVGNFFTYSHRAISAVLRKAGLSVNDLRYIVPQNTNAKAWQVMSSLIKFDFARVYFPTLPEVGHVISGDNIINLKHLEEAGLLRAGDLVLLFMAGYGLTWQCVILEKV